MQYYGQYEHEQIHNYNEENITITLHNQNIWNQFHQLTNEMIVTKVGRRMFPIISVNIRGLDPEKMYTVELSFDQIDTHRWRFVSCQWQPGLKPDPVVNRLSYQHPDSPNYGRTWMKENISFPKVKLTNKVDNHGTGQVLLNSLHKYRPRISIIDVMTKKKIYETSFNETEFIAVTAYQNEEVKALKIRYNPFAKAFLDTGNVKREMIEDNGSNDQMFHSQESSSGGPDRLKIKSYRTSPYNYSQLQQKTSPTNEMTFSPYPSSSTSPFDISSYYAPMLSNNFTYSSASSSQPLLTDNTAYYSNPYYPPSSSYYFPYGTSSSSSASVAQYPFFTPFNYPVNNNSDLDTKSFFYMQPSMNTTSTDDNHLTSLLPMPNDNGQY
ncbi:unnamed protein product [Adineta steineri]|uniref:T-box domain-containing protein n=1 Tax=Adineta steineri TaxID=433720 RepID=A0A813NQC3_9BILA|nr:unnamed protein product [Adineta steineri]CAF3789259.1 unnamed protein product [Adineta steineri]